MKNLSKIVVGAFFVIAACSSEQPAAPSRPPIPPPSGADAGIADSGADGEPQNDCFDTSVNKPTEPGHFLNQCNSAECFGFDNAARIEGFTPGAPLPPLN